MTLLINFVMQLFQSNASGGVVSMGMAFMILYFIYYLINQIFSGVMSSFRGINEEESDK